MKFQIRIRKRYACNSLPIKAYLSIQGFPQIISLTESESSPICYLFFFHKCQPGLSNWSFLGRLQQRPSFSKISNLNEISTFKFQLCALTVCAGWFSIQSQLHQAAPTWQSTVSVFVLTTQVQIRPLDKMISKPINESMVVYYLRLSTP